MNIELLQQLCEASAVSGDEQEVRDILINTLEPCVNEITFDGLGSFVARKGNKGPKVAIVGHMDEVGFMVTHTRAVFCASPPLAAGGISRCSTTG